MPITWEEVGNVVSAVRRRAEELGASVTVAVVDEGGALQALARMDGAPPLSVRIAESKAAAVALFRRDGATLRQMQAEYPEFFGQVNRLTPQPIIVGAGAVLIRRAEAVLGALAVSGGRPEHDEECAATALGSLAGAARNGS